MSHYRVHIPQDILVLLLTVLKKERIHRAFLVTPTVVMARTTDGCLCYTHGVEISETCSFVFPFDPASQPGSDMYIEWDTVTDKKGTIRVENARYEFSDAALSVENVSCSEKTSLQFPVFQPFSRVLASAIPTLSKCAITADQYHSIRAFSGIVFTNRSAFATDGRQFAGWTDSSPTSEVCQTTSAILNAYQAADSRFTQETKTALTTLYEDCVNYPQKYMESFLQDDDLNTPESWLTAFHENYPDLESFIDEFSPVRDNTLEILPIAFPKYLEKILTQDACSYGFEIDYSKGLSDCIYDPLPGAPLFPSSISFFLSTSTYGGRKLPGQLVWHTRVDTFRVNRICPVDSRLFDEYTNFDEKHRYTVSASAFTAFQDHVKNFTRFTTVCTSGVAFVNHQGKLGIGNLLNHEIHSTPTPLPLPAGLEKYVVVPLSFVDIPIPAYISSVTMVFDDSKDDSVVGIIVGNIVYFYARIESFDQDDKRDPYPIRFQDTPLSIPLAPKMRFTPTVIK